MQWTCNHSIGIQAAGRDRFAFLDDAIVAPSLQGKRGNVSDQSQFRLLGQRRFAPFFATQFLGALNDNVFRQGLVILVTF